MRYLDTQMETCSRGLWTTNVFGATHPTGDKKKTRAGPCGTRVLCAAPPGLNTFLTLYPGLTPGATFLTRLTALCLVLFNFSDAVRTEFCNQCVQCNQWYSFLGS